MKFKFRGQDVVAANIRQIALSSRKAIKRALVEFAEEEMAESKQRVPVDTGALRASGHVEPLKEEGSKISVELVYGGPAVDYALEVHEDLEAFHPVGEAKYLESVLLESTPYAKKRIAQKIGTYQE